MLGNVTKHHGNMALPISTFAKEMCRKYIPFVQCILLACDRSAACMFNLALTTFRY